MRILPVISLIMLILIACERNHPPVITDITCAPTTLAAGTTYILKAEASDEDGDPLTYLWRATSGIFLSDTCQAEVIWRSPVDEAGNTIQITVQVSDSLTFVTRTHAIPLTDPELGFIAGTVYFSNFRLPIEGVTVSAGPKQTITGSDGAFLLSGVPAGNYSLNAARNDFGGYSAEISVTKGDTAKRTIEITSVLNTSKLAGIVADNLGNPLDKVRVTVLNPNGTDSKLTTLTNSAGFFRLVYVPFGTWKVTLTKTNTEDIGYIPKEQTVDFEMREFQLNFVLETILFNGEFTDPRDGKKYKFRTYGQKGWMTENLCYLPAVTPESRASVTEALFYVYDYNGTNVDSARQTDSFKAYGVLYNYPAAIKACPPGWHLPSQSTECTDLVATVGSPAGMRLKSTSGWADYGNGTNESKFSAYPGGKFASNTGFGQKQSSAYFWSSTIGTQRMAIGLFSGNPNISYLPESASSGCSVRCVKD